MASSVRAAAHAHTVTAFGPFIISITFRITWKRRLVTIAGDPDEKPAA
jgi:hypothetical protein